VPNAFEHVPRATRGHFLLHFYAAVDRLIRFVSQVALPDDDNALRHCVERFPFIAGYLAEIRQYLPPTVAGEDGAAWWEGQITDWEAAADGYLPLRALTTDAAVDYSGRLALILTGLMEEDSRFGTVFAFLQEPLTYRRPSLEVVGQILVGHGWAGGPDAWSVCRPLLTAGLVEVLNRDAPRSEWLLRIPSMLWDAIRGEIAEHPAPWCRYHPPESFGPASDLILPDAFRAHLENVPSLVERGMVKAVVVRGTPGSERLQVLGALARGLERGVVEVQPSPTRDRDGGALDEQHWSAIGPFATLAHAFPVATYDLGPGETVDLPRIPGYDGPVGVVLGLEGGLRGELGEQALTLTLPSLGVVERRRRWEVALAEHPCPDLLDIADRFHLPGGYIGQVGTLAVAQAGLDARVAVTIADVREASRSLNRQLLDNLATRLEARGTWDHLVVSPETTAKLQELELRCRYRENLLEHLGPAFGSNANRGVRAMLSGPSGTGKTLAARILAGELGMDVYRVDLSAVVNKYIGETEKNLQRVLSRSEELDVILLLDEGDALLGKRTEIKSSNDRYANLETNYLLQRLEHYQGIVVITTNAAQFIDTAFQRRMDVLVSFLPPGEEERLRIWQLHLPNQHRVDDGYLRMIAARCVLTGGQIRNAALHATLIALGSRATVTRRHLDEALLSEYRKAGALYPLVESAVANGPVGDVAAFLGALA